MRIKDIIITIFLVFGLAFITYNDYKIAREQKELNQIQTEYIIPAPKERVEAVISRYYEEHKITLSDCEKSSPTVKIKPKKIKPRIIDIKNDKTIDEIATYIKKKEGFRATAYKDHTQYSIGYGTRANNKNEVITEKEATARLYNHIRTVILPSLTGVTFQSIEQVYAAIDFSYNLGHNSFRNNIVRDDGVIDCSKMMAYNKVRNSQGKLVYNEALAHRRLENFLACSAYEIIEGDNNEKNM